MYIAYALGDLDGSKTLLEMIVEMITPGATTTRHYLNVYFDPTTGKVSKIAITS